MKKILAICAVAALVISLTACHSSADTQSSTPESTAGTTATTKPTTHATTQTTTPPTTEPAFREIVLADTEDVTVRITGVDEDGLLGYTLKVYLENNTDLELMYTVENVSVNGFMVDPFWADTVAAGKKANESISFLESDFVENSIEAVEEITLTLRIYDNNDWLADDIFNETITINP